jgi:hypothetical protein
MENNIKTLYQQIKPKSKAINAVSEATGLKFLYVKNLLSDSGGWSIPEDKINQVIKELKKLVKAQNSKKVKS